MKKLLIFDAYGTLISTGNGSIKATERILTLQENDINAVEFYAEWKKYHRKHMDECNEGMFLTERDIFVNDLKMLYEQYGINRPYEQDVQIMLDSLVDRVVFLEVIDAIGQLRKNYRVVIGSTTDTEPLLVNMTENNLQVDEVYTSEMIKKYKPVKEFYQYILQSEGYKVEDTVFIGDSINDDVIGPHNVGMKTILIDRNNKFSLCEKVQPDYVVKSIEEIIDLRL